MIWRAIANLRASQVTALELNPWEYLSARPQFDSKEAYLKWAHSGDSQHIFYSAVEAKNAHVRASAENPPLKLHGFVADYDAVIDASRMAQAIQEMLPRELLPTAMSQTFSGGARVVWVFEEPVWVDDKDFQDQFLKRLVKELRLGKLGPGYDKNSENLCLYFEQGGPWFLFPEAQPIPAARLTDLQVTAALQVRRVKSALDIPLDVVQEECAKRYPGRLNGFTFQPGARIPVFWIDDNRTDLDAIVSEQGCYSFSTRSEKGWVFWDELLGEEFVKKYKSHRIHEAIENIYFDGKGYWEFNGAGTWNSNTKEDTLQDLKVRGFSHRVEAKKTSTEAEQVLYTIRHQKRVACAVPLPHSKEPVVKFNNERFLNIHDKKPMEMAEEATIEAFPWLREYFMNFLDKYSADKFPPIDYLFAEIQRSYRSLQESRPTSGHVLIFCGLTGRGKSFLTTRIFREIFGSATDAGAFLMQGGTTFNKDLGHSYIWYVDDNRSAANIVEHRQFSEAIKKHVATPEVRYQPKFHDARMIPWYGRIVVSCNDDAESINMIPNMDINIADKLSLFRISDWQAPFKSNYEMNEILNQELPFFLRWLWNQDFSHVMDTDAGASRYGVRAYHHRGLIESAQEHSVELKLTEVLDIWRVQAVPVAEDAEGRAYWEGTSTELLADINNRPNLAQLMRSESVRRFGIFLNQLHKARAWPYLDYVGTDRSKTHKWRVVLPMKNPQLRGL